MASERHRVVVTRDSLVCDWCSSDSLPISWTYVLEPGLICDAPGLKTEDVDGLWATCEDCAAAVEARSADRLAILALARFSTKHGALPIAIHSRMRQAASVHYQEMLSRVLRREKYGGEHTTTARAECTEEQVPLVRALLSGDL